MAGGALFRTEPPHRAAQALAAWLSADGLSESLDGRLSTSLDPARDGRDERWERLAIEAKVSPVFLDRVLEGEVLPGPDEIEAIARTTGGAVAAEMWEQPALFGGWRA